MQAEDVEYVVETDKNFDDVVVDILKAIEQKGWAVFQIYDIRERLRAKGFESHKPLKVIEFCSGKYANHFLSKNRLSSMFLPCRINVLQEENKVRIVGFNPIVISKLFPEVDKQIADEARKEVVGIIDSVR